MDFLTVLTVKTLSEEMRTPVLLYNTAIRHLYATFLYEPVEGVFKPAEILSFPESGFCGYSIELYQIIVKAFGSFNLS